MQKQIHKHIEQFLPNESHVPRYSVVRVVMGVLGGVGMVSLVLGMFGYSVDASTVGQEFVAQSPVRGTKKAAVKANAGSDQTVTLPATSITLDGSASTGIISKYVWKQTKGAKKLVITDANKSVATLSGLKKGTYTFELRVTGNKFVSSKDTVIITIKEEANTNTTLKTNTTPKTPSIKPTEKPFNYPGNTSTSTAGNKSPTANAGVDQTVTLPTNKAKLNAFKSSDADGFIALINWKQVSGPTTVTLAAVETNMEVTTSVLSAGTYVFELSITDDKGAVSTDKVSVTVK